ncbi:MAG: hypothetical protein M3066_16820 [Actinomycetota bacterium]|nr:hypothetical protein [Actinomycetota bacterium]
MPIIGVVGWIAVLAIPLAALLGVVRAMAASASCSRPPPFKESLDRAQLVLVGTAVEVSNFGRWATFSVSDIWKGEVNGDRIRVRGGQSGGGASSADRTYVLGTTYLVFAMAAVEYPPYYGEGPSWTDNACSFTQPYSASLVGFRPGTAHLVGSLPPSQPSPTEAPPARVGRSATSTTGGSGSRGWAWAVVAVIVCTLGAAALLIRRRHRRVMSDHEEGDSLEFRGNG